MKGFWLLTILLAASTCFAEKHKELDWKTGTLVDISFKEGTRWVDYGNGKLQQRRDDAAFYQVDTGDLIYLVKRTLTRGGDKQLKVTVDAPIKYAISGDTFYLMDEEGKPHELSIQAKRLKPKSTDGKDAK